MKKNQENFLFFHSNIYLSCVITSVALKYLIILHVVVLHSPTNSPFRVLSILCLDLLLFSVIGYVSSCYHVSTHNLVTLSLLQGKGFHSFSALPKLSTTLITCIILDQLWFPLLMCSILDFLVYLNGGILSFVLPLNHILINLMIWIFFVKIKCLVTASAFHGVGQIPYFIFLVEMLYFALIVFLLCLLSKSEYYPH